MSRDEIIKKLTELAEEITPTLDATPTENFVSSALYTLAGFVSLAAEQQVAHRLVEDYQKFTHVNMDYERWINNG